MADNNNNKRYVELISADRYVRFEKSQRTPFEEPSPPSLVVETINKPLSIVEKQAYKDIWKMEDEK
jgi:hypothetical protein